MKKRVFIIAIFLFSFPLFISCKQKEEKSVIVESQRGSKVEVEREFVDLMQRHLNAISNRDLQTLESTMSPTGEMQLILPDAEIITGVDEFMKYHREWFKDTTAWKFETRIINTKVGENLGMAVTEIVYSEPQRNGKPYFNRMTVSYVLEKIDGKWFVIKDHASSIEKTD